MQQSNVGIPLNLKLTMTVKEAAQYSNIGINRIDRMLRSPNCPFVLYVGTKKLVKRNTGVLFYDCTNYFFSLNVKID